MKRFRIFIISQSLIVLIISCQKDISELPVYSDVYIAKTWYENRHSQGVFLKFGNLSKEGKYRVTPNWKFAKTYDLKNSKIIETPVSIEGDVGYASKENWEYYQISDDKRFILSETRLIVETKKNQTIGFIMTIIPDQKFLISSNFDSYSSTYKNWQKDFCGVILYHNLDGSFSNGWAFLNGKVITSVKHLNEKDKDLFKPSKMCWAWYYVTWWWDCKGDFGKGIQCVYNENSEFLYIICNDDSYDSSGGGGGGGETEDAIYTPDPCDGDPILGMSIAPTSIGGDITTGMFGCIRPVNYTDCAPNMKFHGGIDIACTPGTSIHSMKSGVVINLENGLPRDSEGDGSSRGDLGNFVTVRFTSSSGSTTDITYSHLTDVYVSYNESITINQVIGSSGTTGNAQGVPNPHVHIQIFQDGDRVNPAGYFGSYISPNGTVTPCDSYK